MTSVKKGRPTIHDTPEALRKARTKASIGVYYRKMGTTQSEAFALKQRNKECKLRMFEERKKAYLELKQMYTQIRLLNTDSINEILRITQSNLANLSEPVPNLRETNTYNVSCETGNIAA